MTVPDREPSTHPASGPTSKWGPYSGAGDFSANMVVVLVILFCALVVALALNALARYFLCPSSRRRSQRQRHPPTDPEKQHPPPPPPQPELAPAIVFSAAAAAPKLADCSICLADFADGDRVRVLPACGHGFHAGCVERWLAARRSCPTCRSSCCHVAAAPTGEGEGRQGGGGVEAAV